VIFIRMELMLISIVAGKMSLIRKSKELDEFTMDVSYVEVMLLIANLKFLIELRIKADADDEIQQETEVK